MRACIRLVILASLMPMVVAAQTVSPPPRPLHLVGDHWTPYEPPTEFPEGATVHIVERGDTLWDLAAKYLSDPYLWPQIWERNPYILDSHWIYPGDPIVIDVAVQEPTPEEVTEGPVAPGDEVVSELPPPGEYEPGEGVEEGMPHPLGSSADVYCFARLFQDEGIFPFKIASGERIEYQMSFTEGDMVYIDGGAGEGVSAGDRFFVYHRARRLMHPVSDADMGIIYTQVGQLKVLCAQEHTSIAEITLACDSVQIGDDLLPFEPVPVPLVLDPVASDRCDEPSGKPTGYVVYAKDEAIDVGIEAVVFVDLGEAEGLYPGQFATIYRPNPVENMPRLVLGEVGFLTVHDGYSTAKISRGWAPVHVGDRIEIK